MPVSQQTEIDLDEGAGLAGRPLADRMRPARLSDYVGQSHILGPDKPLARALAAGRIHSMILWGPPGTGKTTLARLLAAAVDIRFVQISAVMAGVKDIRAAVADAKDARSRDGRGTLLFVDEVHRFNKAQQDGLLPYVEDGTLVLVGATTENPSFEVNNARSRAHAPTCCAAPTPTSSARSSTGRWLTPSTASAIAGWPWTRPCATGSRCAPTATRRR